MDELDRLREDMRTIGRIGREAQRGMRTRDVAIADMVRIASREHVELTDPRPPEGVPEVLSEAAIAEDMRPPHRGLPA